jgi:hypothetical protein
MDPGVVDESYNTGAGVGFGAFVRWRGTGRVGKLKGES